ncbi:MAG TPA: hypothetical protein VFU07_05365 [Candidatus Lumbricidophila sp.]|nr:hypothetical protein [Candidatus Lumbricidophila sp.]
MTAEREQLEQVLRGVGLSDEPDKFDSSIHSWRCEHPDRYGKCDCFQEAVNDILMSDWLKAHDEAIRAEALRLNCPTCGPNDTEPHPKYQGVERCANCKEWLRVTQPEKWMTAHDAAIRADQRVKDAAIARQDTGNMNDLMPIITDERERIEAAILGVKS